MSRRAVFLDRDGTVVEYVEYCLRPEQLRVLPGAAAAIRRLNLAGWAAIVITNQSAVGRGWLRPDDLCAIHEKLRADLAAEGARLDGLIVCPHHPEQGCDCRKPGIAMLRQAAAQLDVRLEASVTIGDRWLDVQTGRAAGTRTVLVRSGHPPEPPSGLCADFEAPTLVEAVDWVLTARARSRPTAAGGPRTEAFA
jgi:histidinol-phosphate phosphatase family protein